MARGAFDTASFSDKARRDLLSLLESVPGKKNLVIQQSLVARIELLVKFSTLQEYGVDRISLLELDTVGSSQRKIIFLAHGEKPKQIQAVASQIKRLQQNATVDHDFNVFWVPRKTLLAQSILEEAGILGEANAGELALYFHSLDDDLLSLELDESFSDLYLKKDFTPIHTSALALATVQQAHGLFPRLLGKGHHAARLISLLQKMRQSDTAMHGYDVNSVPSKAAMPSSEIDSLIVIDRESDFSSALLTQLTYEGLIDEEFGISRSQAEIDTSIIGSASTSEPNQHGHAAAQHQKRKVKLDGSDKLYASLRDANFAIVGSLLNRVARRLQSDYEERHGQKSVAELREFVSKMPGYQAEQQSLKTHTSLAEEILKNTRTDIFRKMLEVQQNLVAGVDSTAVIEIIEQLIARDAPLTTVLRLICLQSVSIGGIAQKTYDSLRRQVVQAYGYQHLLTFSALKKMGLLQPRASGGAFAITGAAGPAQGETTNYAAARRQLHLIMDDVSEQDPHDIAYAYSGYAPLSIRILQCVLQKPYLTTLRTTSATSLTSASTSTATSDGWRGFESVLANIKGPTVDEVQTSGDRASRAKQVLEGRGGKKLTLVFFLGGVTFAEVAAVRFLAKQEEAKRRVVVCTTGIVSGERMMRAAVEMSETGEAA